MIHHFYDSLNGVVSVYEESLDPGDTKFKVQGRKYIFRKHFPQFANTTYLDLDCLNPAKLSSKICEE